MGTRLTSRLPFPVLVVGAGSRPSKEETSCVPYWLPGSPRPWAGSRVVMEPDPMADCANQHYVPQFYFRNFSTTGRTIGTLLTRRGTIIPCASIKGQCARQNFYGSKDLERLFSQVELQQSAGIRAALEVAWKKGAPFFSPEELAWFFEAVVFQRGRTALEIEKTFPAREKFLLECFKHYLKHSPRVENVDEIVREIEAGNVRLTQRPSATIAQVLSIALESRLLITDMSLCLLRNRTDYPFIFSDAPVVFYNTYCRKVRNRGVLGLQCPGLQIFYPLNSWTTALLFDADKYECGFKDFLAYDVVERSDVSQMNALQLHHSLSTAYFGDPRHEEYVQELWNAHRASLSVPRYQSRIRPNLLVDGRPPKGDLLQVLEPQLPFDLNLSFVHCNPVSEHEYVYRPRSPELRKEVQDRCLSPHGVQPSSTRVPE